MHFMDIKHAYCTTSEAAELLGVSVGTVQTWVERGQLAAWKTAGGHRRVSREAVNRLLAQPVDKRLPPVDAAVPEPGTRSRPCVMVVDDDVNLLRLYDARISRWPLAPQTLCMNNAVLALLRMGRSRPDLLILDLHMPGMDGFSLLHSLRHSAELGDTPIAVVTGLDEASIEDHGGLPADVEVFHKPIPFDRLQAMWMEVLAAKGFVQDDLPTLPAPLRAAMPSRF